MTYVRRLINFLLASLFMIFGSYFGYLNMDRVYVNVPLMGEFRVVGFLAFLVSFILGGMFAAIFFGYDYARKSMEVRKSRRALSRVEKEPHRRVSRFLEEESQSQLPRKEPSL